MKSKLLFQIVFFAISLPVLAHPAEPLEAADSLSFDAGKREERNVMLNASDATKPREIQIGLPSEDVNVTGSLFLCCTSTFPPLEK